MTTARRAGFVVVVLVLAFVAAGPAALAHPLGNFTVNHYDGLTLSPDRVDVAVVVDSAELPTAAEKPRIDTDGDGRMSEGELTTFARQRCPVIADAVRASITPRDGVAQPLTFEVTGGDAVLASGAAGLPTLRLSCGLRAPAELTAAATLDYGNTFLAERVGWKEITVTGDGVRAVDPPVPSASISDELRSYPGDLLTSPRNDESVTVRVSPGAGGPAAVASTSSTTGDPVTRAMASADRYLENLVGGALTPLVGLLGVMVAVALGAGHAVLPGHGKTVMAAYLAGTRGSRRDALTVGATVTFTHTVGVLAIGSLIFAGSQFAGEQVLRWLSVISGVLVAAIGVSLLRSAIVQRHRRAEVVAQELVAVGAPEPAVHGHDHSHGHSHDSGGATYSRGGLIGMGIVGGLVPSPSATVILVAALGLGRTVFGLGLVLAYGFGMAATLTAVGLVLVRARSRLDVVRESGRLSARTTRRVRALTAVLPLVTAYMVLLVGLGLAVRGVLNPY